MGSEKTLTAMLEGWSQRTPQARAILDRETDWSYQELASESRRVAQGLANLGVSPGDRVGFWLPNVGAYLALFFACARLGAIAVSVNTRYRAQEVEDIVGRSGCKILVLWPTFKGIPFLEILADVDKEALSGLESVILYQEEGDPQIPVLPSPLAGKKIVTYEELRRSSPFLEDHATSESPCLIFTTSGTTAAPKFVLHKQSGLVIHANEVSEYFDYTAPQTVILQSLPFCGTFGLSQTMATLACGRSIINMPVYNAEQAVELMQVHDVTHTNGTDDMFSQILEIAPEEIPFPKFQYAGYGAFNPNLENIASQSEARGMKLVGLYGMSEMQAFASRQDLEAPLEYRARGGGKLVSKKASVRVRDPETGRILEHGKNGEIEFKGPSLLKEYFQNPIATEKAFTDDGFLRTGDLGYTEGENAFVYLARMGDVLRLGGFLVSPAEIESRLQKHPIVEQAQVVGVKTDSGIRAFAFVVPKGGATFDEKILKEHCARGLAKFKVPLSIMPLNALPVTDGPNGVKIQRGKLRETAQAKVNEG